MTLNFWKVKTVYEADAAANVTVPTVNGYYGTKVIKELLEPWAVKKDIVVAADSYFDSEQYAKSLEEPWIHLCGQAGINSASNIKYSK